MKQLTIILALTTIIFSACTTSHIIVGNTRAPTSPDSIKIYLTSPKKFEQIALIDADDLGHLSFTGQQKTNAAINRAKVDAAKLGANGLLLTGVGEQLTGGVATTTGQINGNTYTGITTVAHGRIRKVSALAIWVIEE